tara:strand:- start:15294 stop:15656 length:363 start_codon:yes stop_codon:yes gene_type:complete
MWTRKLQTYLFFAILGGFVSYVIFSKSNIQVDVESYQLEINLLQQKIDSISMQNNELKYEADSLSSKLVEYDGRIKRLNTRIYVIKNETKEKLNAIDSFGSSELQKFFTDRYLKQQDTIN